MNKKFKLRKWLTLDETVTYLSVLVEEDFTRADVINLVIEERLRVFWTLQHQPAQAVVPFTIMQNFWEIAEELWDPVLKIRRGLAKKKGELDNLEELMNPYIREALIAPNGTYLKGYQADDHLNGRFEIPFNLCRSIKDYFVSLITGEGGELTPLDGQTVRDEQGNYWNLLDPTFEEGALKDREYHPSAVIPTIDQISFRRCDIELLIKEQFEPEQSLLTPALPIHPATDPNHENYPPELHAAIEAWLYHYHYPRVKISEGQHTPVTVTWLGDHWPSISPTAARARIAPVINPYHNKNKGTFAEK